MGKIKIKTPAVKMSVLPVVTDSPSGVHWSCSPASIPRKNRAPIVNF